jgi:hypothetical protein
LGPIPRKEKEKSRRDGGTHFSFEKTMTRGSGGLAVVSEKLCKLHSKEVRNYEFEVFVGSQWLREEERKS